MSLSKCSALQVCFHVWIDLILISVNFFYVETAKFALLILPVRLTDNTEANIPVHEIKQHKTASSSGIIIYISLKRVIQALGEMANLNDLKHDLTLS